MNRILVVCVVAVVSSCAPKKPKPPTVSTPKPYTLVAPTVPASSERVMALADLDAKWLERSRKARLFDGKRSMVRVRTPGATGPATPANTKFVIVTLGNRSGSQGVDTDRDGLSDEAETSIGTNPMSADTDGDGIPDGFEVFGSGTRAELADSDGDGTPDGTELDLDDVGTYADADGDGFLNGQERCSFGSNVDALDSDGDGFGDDYEYYFETPMNDASHPTVDSDNDGQPDDFEVANGFDAKNPDSALPDSDDDALPDFADEDDSTKHAMVEGRRRAAVPANSVDLYFPSNEHRENTEAQPKG